MATIYFIAWFCVAFILEWRLLIPVAVEGQSVDKQLNNTTEVFVTGFGKTLRMGFFSETWIWCMANKLYHRANPRSSLGPITRFVVEIQHFVCDCTTPPIRDIMVHRYCYARIWCFSILHVNWNGLWTVPFEKIEQGLDFIFQNDTRLFFDAQAA